jgi:peptide methionine sulfoxide reductase msrA/msrB
MRLPLIATLAAALMMSIAVRAAESPAQEPSMKLKSKSPNVYVRVIGPDGKLSAPVVMPRVIHTDTEWQKLLTPEQFRIMRTQGTEAAFCGGLLKNKEAGVYVCAACGLPLFASGAKFESGTGWPSFFQPVANENILERADMSHGMVRTEINCTRCGSHLGHLFPDGPQPTGLRYCLNSESLKFIAEPDLAKHAEAVPPLETAEVVIAGGCFWCVEAVFEELDGVLDAESGYSGGEANTANYQTVSTGKTGHAEAVRIVYDPKRVTLEQILDVHFATHDPTTLNRQGGDHGTQYRSTIFYKDAKELRAAKAVIAKLTEEKKFPDPVVTTLEPLKKFYPAEIYHQNFVCRNPAQGYVRAVALPKVDKIRHILGDATALKAIQ